MIITGRVTEIIYENKDNGYVIAVANVEAKLVPNEYRPMSCSKHDRNCDICVLGYFTLIDNGMYEFEGNWVKHQSFGWQLKFTSCAPYMPKGEATREEVIAYLSSGFFKGIKNRTANKIYDHFGKDTMKIINESPSRLSEVSGVSQKKVISAFDNFDQAKAHQDLCMLLMPFGITQKKVATIYEKYKTTAIHVLKTDPYRLCKDIDGFGFKTADSLAIASQLDLRSSFRIKAAITHVLKNTAEKEGHLYLPKKDLFKNLNELLNQSSAVQHAIMNDPKAVSVTTTDIEQCLGDMELTNAIINDERDYYYTPYYHMEMQVARNIKRILNTKTKASNKYTRQQLNSMVAQIESINHMTYAERQKDAMIESVLNNVLILTGGPGTGKSTTLNAILKMQSSTNSSKRVNVLKASDDGGIVLAAPTGRAAKRMKETTDQHSSTIHRLLEYREGRFQKDESDPLDADVIVIDEFSMVDMFLMLSLLSAVPEGCRLILIGDENQLPSVGPGTVLKSLIESGIVPTVKLDRVFRQADTSKIAINSDLIKNGVTELEYAPDFQLIELNDKSSEEDALEALLINYKELLDSVEGDYHKVQVLTPYRKGRLISSEKLNPHLAKIANPRPEEEVKVQTNVCTYHLYDKVMQINNNYDKFVFNGDIGVITDIMEIGGSGVEKHSKSTRRQHKITVMYDTHIVTYTQEELIAQVELAYACTVHKSQGSEIENVLMPVIRNQQFFIERDILYTGITRAKKNVRLVGHKRTIIHAIQTVSAKKRYTKLTKRLVTAENHICVYKYTHNCTGDIHYRFKKTTDSNYTIDSGSYYVIPQQCKPKEINKIAHVICEGKSGTIYTYRLDAKNSKLCVVSEAGNYTVLKPYIA